VDLLVYRMDELHIHQHRRFKSSDPSLKEIHSQWEQSLRKAVTALPPIQFEGGGPNEF